MNESNQAKLLDEFLDRLARDAGAEPPAELEANLAEFARATVTATGNLAAPAARSTAQGWQKVLGEVQTQTAPRPAVLRPRRNWRKFALAGLGLAASLALGLLILSALSLGNIPSPREGFSPAAGGTSSLSPTTNSATLIYQEVLQPQNIKADPEQLKSALDIMQQRAKTMQIPGLNLKLQGSQLILELQVQKDQAQQFKETVGLLRIITDPGRIEFVEVGTEPVKIGEQLQTSYCASGSLFEKAPEPCSTQINKPGKGPRLNTVGQPFQTLLTGNQLDFTKLQLATADSSQTIKFAVKGQDDILTLQKYLSLDKSQQIALVLDQQVIALLPPKVLISGAGEISSKDFNLTGNPKLDAISLAALLKFGELPLNFEVVSSRQL